MYNYTMRMADICARYVSASLTVVDIPLCSTRLCRPEQFRFMLLIPVDVLLYRAGDIHPRHIRFLPLIAVDIPL